MKKILYFFVGVFTLSMTFIACDDDDDSGTTSRNSTFSVTPEIAAAGTYEGDYIRVQSGTTDTTENKGTIIISARDTAYCANISFVCSGFEFTDFNSVTNITYANNGFMFSNDLSTFVIDNKEQSVPFYGTIDENKNIIARFTITQKSGRSTKVFYYTFNGKLSSVTTE